MVKIPFETTDVRPVRYAAKPGVWVEHERPHDVRHGELSVFKTADDAVPCIYAAIETHAGSGGVVIELVINREGQNEFVREVMQRTTRWPEVRAALIARLARLGFDVSNVEARSPEVTARPARTTPKPRAPRREPSLGPMFEDPTIRMVGVQLFSHPIDEEDVLSDGPHDYE